MSDELKRLLGLVHDGITTFDFDGKIVPCIIVDKEKYDEMISESLGKALSVETDLNILQDGLGHVFVEVKLSFSNNSKVEKFLINAMTDLPFFESLAKTTMLALYSPKSAHDGNDVFMIQLPNTNSVYHALDIIKRALAK